MPPVPVVDPVVMRNPSSTGGLSSAPVEPPLALGDDRPSAVAAGLAGHGHHPLHERGLVVGDASALPVRTPRLAQCSARPPLRDPQPLLHLLDRSQQPGQAQTCPEATSYEGGDVQSAFKAWR